MRLLVTALLLSTANATGPVAISLNAPYVSLSYGKPAQFLATVTGTSQTGAVWAVNGVVNGNASVGTVSAAGLYTAPSSAGSYTVTATSVADLTQTASATVAVSHKAGIDVSPATASLGLGQTLQYTSGVAGNKSVNWSVNGFPGGNSTVGTISTSGLYAAPVSLAATTPFTISAQSATDSSRVSIAIVSVTGGVSSPPPVSISVSPTSASVQVSTAQPFGATVSGSTNTSATWSVNGVPGGSSATGTISSSGLYNAPASVPSPATVTVTATSSADPSKSASASVTITAGVSVSVSPTTASVQVSATQSFIPTVTGSTNTNVTWSVNGVAGGNTTTGTVSSSGLYTAPASVPSPATVTVTATSSADPSKSASATVTITAAVSVSVSPTTASVHVSATQSFIPTVTGSTNTNVTWAVNGVVGGNTTVGTISSSGLYTAPATVPSPATVTVTATSSADPSKSASATVTITAAVSVSVSPTSASVQVSATQSFIPTVTGSTNTNVTWSVNGVAGGNTTTGTVSSSGLYTAPATVPSPATVTVTATSSADLSKSASATVTITAGVSVSVSPTSASVQVSATQSFIPTVTGSTNTNVTWAVNGVAGGNTTTGTVSSSGLYTAPASVPSPATVTVTATSSADPSKSASATVTITAAVSVSVSPTTASVHVSATQSFIPTVTGSTNTNVTWSVNGVAGGNATTGTVSSSGLYTAPATVPSPATVTVTATSSADLSKSASATVTITAGVSVSVSPTSASVQVSATQSFIPTVTGSTNTNVTWAVNGIAGGNTTTGTVSSSGLYTAPASVPSPATVTVTATSSADPSKSASASVTITAGVSVSVSPTTASVQVSATQSFIPTVTGSTNTNVTWSVNGVAGGNTTVGTISSSGLYTAPASVPSPATVTVTATSSADPTKSASATISFAAVAISVSPSAASLTGGQSTTLKATVTGSSNTSVTWSMSPSVGTIAGGVYTAPATIASAQTVTVTAASAADPTKTASATISLVPPAAVAISITPSSASLSGGQSATFTATVTGSSNTAVNWTVAPSLGTLANGVYTAPALISLQQTVTVAAASAADPTKIATASVTLLPSVSVSVVPTSATLTPSQSQQFNASLSGTTNPNVTWSMSPNVGSLSNGLYQAPATINSEQTVTVTATSLADATKTGSATITLVPTVGIALTPSSISLSGGQSTQFNVINAGAPAAAATVTWTLAPQVGNITNGVYTAPVTISALQTVVLTVASIANPTQTATANITLNTSAPAASVSPSLASLSPSGTQQFTATGLGTNPIWTISPTTGTITTGGLYAAPSSVTTQTTVTVTATNATNSSQSATATVTLNPAASQTPPPTTITLPIEVTGPSGTTQSVSFNIASGTSLSGLTLSLQIHGLRYQTQASFQLNTSGWLPINDSTMTYLGLGANYGGIGGGYTTLKMTTPVPSGSLQTGANTISFQFNGTDGVSSGFRVLAFNIQTSSGTQLISSGTFVNDDPNTWQPPSTSPSDISAGQTLFQTAALTVPNSSGSSTTILAHCGDCHTQDGRDLKYFNYSNNSIEARSVFHGLSAQQGSQIASYIRSLNVPNPGRPWNPPYQPGPGMDSQPVENWAAGAGLDAVLDTDADMQQYIMPGGSTAGWAANQYLNPRETPIALQLRDWNSWLPQVHPMDAFGASFTSQGIFTFYQKLRGELVANNPTIYQESLGDFYNWLVLGGEKYMIPLESQTNWDANNMRQKVYGAALWQMVKLWELNQEFGLEGMVNQVYGAKANPRGWYGSQAFNTSPNMLHIPVGPGIANGTQTGFSYLEFIWYETQMILNDGQGQQEDHNPFDYGYVGSALRGLSLNSGDAPGAMLQTFWMIKSLQEETLSGVGPQAGNDGWHPGWTAPETLVDWNWGTLWTEVAPALRTTMLQAYTQYWFAQASQYTPQEFYTGSWASATDQPATLPFETTFAGEVWFMLPRLAYYGVEQSLVSSIGAWAAKIWPLGNWTLDVSATCTDGTHCSDGY